MQDEVGPRGVANVGRVLDDLKRLARFGALDPGISRPAYSAPDMAARRWLANRFADAGLEPAIDGIGNLIGRDPEARTVVLAGSHSDSVPNGGWLDGALGVIFGLEAARCWREANPGAPMGVDVISFADEEGTFDGCLGSRAFCGLWGGLAPGDTSALASALGHAGLSGQVLPGFDAGRHKAFLEAHIEQGPRLESGGIDIGVVQGIVGVRRQRLRFRGRADHAGTTPMDLRRNAGRAMFAFGAALDAAWTRAATPGAVWNMGVVSVTPGAANVVPSSAEVVVEYRHLDRAVIDRMAEDVRRIAAESSVPVEIEAFGSLEPSTMDAALVADLEAAALAEGASSLTLGSGAGHDAMILSRVVPSGMMFVPSIGGRSHDPAEDTAEHDLARGVAVYVAWVFRVLERLASH